MTATITLHTDPPSAHLVWEAADLPAGTHTIKVTRTADGVSYVVRGASALFADGGAVLDDYEIPLGVQVSYVAEAFDSDGAPLGAQDALTGQVDTDPSMGWVSDPTNPNAVVQVELKDDFAQDLITVRQVQTYQVGDRVVALLGALGKLTSIPLRMQTKTIPDYHTLVGILRQTAVLIRTAPPTLQPRLLYVVVPTVKATQQDVQWGGGWVLYDIQGDEIDATTLDILIPVVTWQDYIDAFPTWADMEAAYSTWFDAMKNPPV
jgi:hypothetical protein